MRAEVEQAYEEGGDIQQTSRRRIVGSIGAVSKVILPSGEISYVNTGGREVNQQPMAKWELKRLAKEVKPDELEALASERSLAAGGEGGRIEVYAGGAMEWVPNGPGGVPQPTTGDVFFDPIAEEQRKLQGDTNMKQLMRRMISEGLVHKPSSSAATRLRLMRGQKKFARGGAVKKFQAGGLAAATLDEEEEVFEPAAMTGIDEILASVTPDPKPDLYKMARMTKETALQQLRAGQSEFQERKAKQNKRAEQDRWLAMAQAMLSPTKTGAFGENIGMAAGALRQQSAQQTEVEALHAAEEQRFAEREAEIAGDYFDALGNLEGFKNNSRARVVGSKTVIDPAQADAVASGEMKEEDADRVWANAIMQPDGKVQTSIALDRSGKPYRVVEPKKDPQQAAAQRAAETGAAASVTQQYVHARQGLQAIPMVRRYQRAYALLSTLKEDTSGLTEAMRRVAQFAGISEVIDDNTTLARLHGMFGKQVLQDLRLLTGTKTDFEYAQVEKMNPGLGKSTEENLGLIEDQLRVLGTMVDKGEFAAQEISEGPGIENREFMLQEYLRFRQMQAEAAVEYDATTRVAPSSKLEALIEAVRENEGNLEEQTQHIQMFREYYDIPEEVALQLRSAGAGI